MSIINLDQRPIAIDPITKSQNFDGIFIKSMHSGLAIMRMKCPESSYDLESPEYNVIYHMVAPASNSIPITPIPIRPSYPNFVVGSSSTKQQYFFANFYLDLSAVPVGKHDISIPLVKVTGASNATIISVEQVEFRGRIFVADGYFNSDTASGGVMVPEASLTQKITQVQLFNDPKIKQLVKKGNIGELTKEIMGILLLPTGYDTNVQFVEPYEGQFSPLPFSDPWWKVAAAIVAIIAGAVALVWLVGGALGAWDNPVTSTEDRAGDPETGRDDCARCTGGDVSGGQGDPVWGAFVTVAVLGAAVAHSDMIDPFRRGEEKSIPVKGDKTISERLISKIKYNDIPLPGTPYKISLDWEFERKGKIGIDYPPVKSHDEYQNIHYIRNYKVDTIDGEKTYVRDSIHEIGFVLDLQNSQDFARYKQERSDGLRKNEPEFYVYGILKHKLTKVSKTAFFDIQSDGTYHGYFPITSSDFLGYWDVMIVIQNVNNANFDDKPTVQAQTIGGFIYSNNFSLKHDESTGSCNITPNWDISINLE